MFVFICACAHVCPALRCVTRPVSLKPGAVNHEGVLGKEGVGGGMQILLAVNRPQENGCLRKP